jgi:hypothetical protein
VVAIPKRNAIQACGVVRTSLEQLAGCRCMKETQKTRMSQRVAAMLAMATIFAMLSSPLCLPLCMRIACPPQFSAQPSQEVECHGGAGVHPGATATYLTVPKRCGQGELPAVIRQSISRVGNDFLQRKSAAKSNVRGAQSPSQVQTLGAKCGGDCKSPPQLNLSARTVRLRI